MTINDWLKENDLEEASPVAQARALGISTVTLWRILNKKTGIAARTMETIVKKTKGRVKYEDLAGGASAQ